MTDTAGVLVADAGSWHQVQMQQIVEHGIQVLIPPDAGNGRALDPAGPEASMRSCVACFTPSSTVIFIANARA